MNKDFDEITLAESNVSMKLADIQRRCSELLSEPGQIGGLSLEESSDASDDNNPYNRG